MIVRIINTDKNSWYSECMGEYFYAFQCENSPTIFFNQVLFFYPNHIEIVKSVPKGTKINTTVFQLKSISN
jgi:hypothetical protein